MHRTRIARDVAALSTALTALALLAPRGGAQLNKTFAYTVDNEQSSLQPSTVAAGDVDGDGRNDVVIVGVNVSWQIVVGLGTPQGPLAWQPPILIPLVTSDLKLADVNLDGKLDVVAFSTCPTPGGCPRLQTFLGDGAGGFGAPILSPLLLAGSPGTIRKLAIGDLNGDGKPDAAACTSYASGSSPDNLVVAIGDGAGTFASSPSIPSNGRLWDVVLADLNHDGKLDLAAGNGFAGASPAIEIFLGNGAGALAPPLSTSVPGTPLGVAVGDVNQDGQLDVAAALDPGPGNTGLLSLLAGTGTGALLAPVNLPTTDEGTHAVLLIDLDGDGVLDALTCEVSDITYFAGSGALGLQAQGIVTMPQTIQLIGADLNQDHLPDLVAATNPNKGVSILRCVRVPTFGSGVATPVASIAPAVFATGDLDGDGAPDAVAIGASPGNLQVLRGDGAGALSAFGPPRAAGGMPIAAALADLNGDGRLDVAVGRQGTPSLAVLFGDGLGGFGAPTTILGGMADVSLLAVGDITGDGKPDIAGGQRAGTATSLAIWPATGAGSFASATQLAGTDLLSAIALGDLNEDGKADVAVSGVSFAFGTKYLTTSFGLGGGTSFVTVDFPRAVAIADATGDGHADVIVGGLYRMHVHAGDGTGAVPNLASQDDATFKGVKSEMRRLEPCDINGDGRADFAAPPVGVGLTNELFLADDAGAFVSSAFLVPGAGDELSSLVDLDGDGWLDLAGPSYATANVIVHRNFTPSPAGTSPFGTGTPGCSGRLGLVADGTPSIGSPVFGFVATGAPRNALGLGILGNVANPGGFDLFGAKIQVDLFASTFLFSFDAHGGAGSSAFAKLPIPNQPSLAGATLHAQVIWVENAKQGWSCSASPFDLVSTRGVTWTIH